MEGQHPEKKGEKEKGADLTLEEAKERIAELTAEVERLRSAAKSDDVPEGRTIFSNRTTIKAILCRDDEGAGLVNKTFIICGWVRTIRLAQKNTIAFVSLNDGSTFKSLQIVVDNDVPGFADLERTDANTGASVWAKGKLVASKGKGQKVEMLAAKVKLLGGSDPMSYPLAPKEHTMEHLRGHAHLRARTATVSAMARIRNALAFATHTFFQERGFIYLHTPIITASDCEGAGELFQVTTLLNPPQKATKTYLHNIPTILAGKETLESGEVRELREIDYTEDFFDRPAYLTVSGQLNGEQYACALSNIYTFGPTFRAEYSFTPRHLAEFWMIEPEMAFYDLQDNMALAEAYLKFTLQYALDHCPDDMAFFDKQDKSKPSLLTRLKHVIETPFRRITYTEAIEALIKSGKKFEVDPVWGIDMGSEHERFLTEQIFKMPIIVTDYPKDFKAFYMRQNDDGRTVAAMDVLVPRVGEIIGGSQREERMDMLLKMIAEKKLKPESYAHYLDLRRFGSVPHAGFGLGFERLVMFCTGIDNIRDVIPFPRWPKHAEF